MRNLSSIFLAFVVIPRMLLGQDIPLPVKAYGESRAKDIQQDFGEAFLSQRVEFFEIDFNLDGLDDLAVSDEILLGNGGGDYHIYLKQADGSYNSVGWFDCNETIRIKPLKAGLTSIFVIDPMGAEGFDLIVSTFDGRNFKKVKKYSFPYSENPDSLTAPITGPNSTLTGVKRSGAFPLRQFIKK